MLIFDRCLHTVAVVRPVKYECDLKDLIYMLLKKKPRISPKGKK